MLYVEYDRWRSEFSCIVPDVKHGSPFGGGSDRQVSRVTRVVLIRPVLLKLILPGAPCTQMNQASWWLSFPGIDSQENANDNIRLVQGQRIVLGGRDAREVPDSTK